MVLNTSRFRYTALTTTKNGRETYGLVSGFNALKNMTPNQYITWTVLSQYAGRPDLIANYFYTDVQKEWFVVFANKPLNTFNWPNTGDKIKIPLKSFVESLL